MHANPFRPTRLRQRGQGMTEYIIIVALVAIAAIAAFTFFGGTLRSQLGGVARELSGQDSNEARANARSRADDVVTEGDENKNMREYHADSARQN